MNGLVCLHGFTGSPESWAATIDCLGDEVTTVVPWLAGHGKPAQRSSGSFEQEVEHIGRLVADSFSEPVHLCGYSMGARVALGLILESPDLFSAATLIGAHAGLDSETARCARREEDDRRAARIEQEGLASFIADWTNRTLFASQANLEPGILERQKEIRSGHQGSGLASSLRILGVGSMPSYWSRLGEILLPVDLVVGELDSKFMKVARRMSLVASQLSLRVAPGLGHNVVLENPTFVADVLAGATSFRRPLP